MCYVMTLERDILENLPDYPRDNITTVTAAKGHTYNRAKGVTTVRADETTMAYLKALLCKVRTLEKEKSTFESRPPRKITMLHLTHALVRIIDTHYNN